MSKLESYGVNLLPIALAAGILSGMEKALLGAKTDAEDVALNASYNFTGRRLGRNFAQHIRLYNLLVGRAAAPPLKALEAIEATAIRKLTAALGTLGMDETLWGAIPEAQQGAAQMAMLEVAQATWLWRLPLPN